MMTIDRNEIIKIQVIEESMNMVLFVHQRNSSSPIVVKGEDGKGRQHVAAMLEYHAKAFSSLRAMPFKTEKVTNQEIEELRNCNPSKICLNPKPTKEQWGLKLGALLYGKAVDNNQALNTDVLKAVIKLNFVEQLADVHGMMKNEEKSQLLKTGLLEANRNMANAMFGLGQIQPRSI
jgi:hypothetical protein